MAERSNVPGLTDDDVAALFEGMPTAYLVMSADLEIVGANRAYLELLGHSREGLVGRYVFDAFPPEASSLDEQGRNPLQISFERARDSGEIDYMPVLHYDVVLPSTGEVVERFWSIVNAPIRDADGRTTLLLQRVEDVTEYVHERRALRDEREQGDTWRRRVEAVEAELFTRAQDLREALQAQEQVARRLAGLANAALQLAAAENLADLTETVVFAGLAAMGADGGALAVRNDASGLRLTVTDSLGEAMRTRFTELSLDDPLPVAAAARTGEPVLLGNAEEVRAWSSTMAEVHGLTARDAWAALPLRTGDRLLGSLTASWSEPQTFDPDEIALLSAFAALCAQALARLQTREAEQRANASARAMSEALQRSLLTAPPEPEDLEIVVRYRPAAEQVQVGGDWYDAFFVGDGAVCLVVGDVTGHDRQAAAVMGQVRNLLRGIAYAVGEPPAAVLGVVDRAIRDLDVGALATAVLARVEQTEEQAERGVRLLRWSNAGHPPPLLVRADGSATMLRADPDLLLGLDVDSPRSDHTHELWPGETVVLYTDGLVERRGEDLDDGLAWLQTAAGQRCELSAEALADSLLAEVAGAQDDIALLVLRAHPEDRPRPEGV